MSAIVSLQGSTGLVKALAEDFQALSNAHSSTPRALSKAKNVFRTKTAIAAALNAYREFSRANDLRFPLMQRNAKQSEAKNNVGREVQNRQYRSPHPELHKAKHRTQTPQTSNP
jgi:hypothetical protein